MKLNALTIAKLKPKDARQEIADDGTPGLKLIVQPTGAKSWALRFRRPDQTQGRINLGPLDQSGGEAVGEPEIGQPLTLAAARALAGKINHERKRGVDVVARRQAERNQIRVEIASRSSNPFHTAVLDFIDDHVVRKTGQPPRRLRETEVLLGIDKGKDKNNAPLPGGLCDRWRDRTLAEITPDDIYKAIDDTRRVGVPGYGRRKSGRSDAMGRRMGAALGSLFRWLVAHRRIAVNPTIGVHKPAAPPARDRVLNQSGELQAFWNACSNTRELEGAMLKLLLLTGCQLKEIASLERSEITADAAMIRLPGSRTKNGLPHDVPLSSLARKILDSVPIISGSKFVFTRDGKHPIQDFSKIKARLDVLMDEEIPAWRVHDLRRTAATGMAEIGIAPHIVEAALNHVSGAKAGVAGTYNRARYEPEKRDALEKWAAHIERIVAR